MARGRERPGQGWGVQQSGEPVTMLLDAWGHGAVSDCSSRRALARDGQISPLIYKAETDFDMKSPLLKCWQLINFLKIQ